MYARVARWEDGDGEAMRRTAEDMNARADSGPPEGVPAKGFLMLIDPENGRSLAVALFETEADLRTGDAALDAMSPDPDQMVGRRASVELYEVAVDVRT